MSGYIVKSVASKTTSYAAWATPAKRHKGTPVVEWTRNRNEASRFTKVEAEAIAQAKCDQRGVKYGGKPGEDRVYTHKA